MQSTKQQTKWSKCGWVHTYCIILYNLRLKLLKILQVFLAHSYAFTRVPFDWIPKALARCRKWWCPVQEALVCHRVSSQAMSWFLRGPSRCGVLGMPKLASCEDLFEYFVLVLAVLNLNVWDKCSTSFSLGLHLGIAFMIWPGTGPCICKEWFSFSRTHDFPPSQIRLPE